MPDALLTLLKWCLLVLIYLFFFRVLQATWMTATGPRGTKAQPTSQQGPRSQSQAPGSRLLVLEPPEMAGRTFIIGNELSIGRSAGSSVTLDDTYVSQMHAKVTTGESGVVLEDLGSTNGTYLNRQKVGPPVVMVIGDRLQVGGTIMELQR